MAEEAKRKRILVVDDEPDLCDLVAIELGDLDVEQATTYEEARAKLQAERYHLAILDIMGVQGFDLLSEFAEKVPCIMFTARALDPAHLKQAIVGRAVLYLPKQEICRLPEYVARALRSPGPLWPWLFRRLDFDALFGRGWAAKDPVLREHASGAPPSAEG
jgi:DNA-binding NtrC family response regulator